MKRLALVPAALLFVIAAAVQAQQGQTPSTSSGQVPPAQPQAQQPQQRPQQPPLGPNEWRIDRSHSQANFSVRHNVVSTVRGQLGPMSGRIEYDGKDVKSIVVDVAIDVTGITTANESRDKDLRSENFFDTAKFPNMTFKSKRIEPGANGKFKVVGDLTIRDQTREVVLDVEGPSNVMKNQRGVLIGATATTTINRRDFGILYNRMIEALPVVSDEVQVTIDLQLNRPALPGTTQQ
jgi:polyisoprenoid-binding protein YceI